MTNEEIIALAEQVRVLSVLAGAASEEVRTTHERYKAATKASSDAHEKLYAARDALFFALIRTETEVGVT